MQTVAENKKTPWARVAPSPELSETRQPTEEVAASTYELLSVQGWCLWKCGVLNGDIIAVVRDELVKTAADLVEDIPSGYPVYYEQELFELLDADDAMVRMVHEAKKKAKVNIVSG